MSMSEDLADWSDWDVAANSYGRAIGVFDGATRRQVLRVVLTDNPFGAGLHAGVLALVDAGVLERRVEPEEQFRWSFRAADTLLGEPDDWESKPTALELPGLESTPSPPEPDPEPARQPFWKRGRR